MKTYGKRRKMRSKYFFFSLQNTQHEFHRYGASPAAAPTQKAVRQRVLSRVSAQVTSSLSVSIKEKALTNVTQEGLRHREIIQAPRKSHPPWCVHTVCTV